MAEYSPMGGESEPVKVLGLVQSTKIPDRWTAELSSGEKLRVNVALIADYSLYSGRELSEAELDSLRSAAGIAATRARAMRILGARLMSGKELTDRLTGRGESAENAENTVAWLQGLGIVNDIEYAASIVRHYSAGGYGPAKIKSELYRRGVPRELWDAALLGLPEPDDKLQTLIHSRLRGKAPDDRELKRLSDMLLRRGFGWEDIKDALSRYTTEIEED